ncbi:hypothetical protein FACS1894219_05410 [Clostridia bacterium]|nr:hypothetical protein FACS1894219_05410 [Clostridia bacterium]
MERINLLYTTAESELLKLTEYSFIDDLNLYGLFEINSNKLDLRQYFTASAEVIDYRQSIFEELLQCPVEEIKSIIQIVERVLDLRLSKKDATDTIAILYTISEIDAYIQLINAINIFTQKYGFKSAGLAKLSDYAKSVVESDEFIKLAEMSAEA